MVFTLSPAPWASHDTPLLVTREIGIQRNLATASQTRVTRGLRSSSLATAREYAAALARLQVSAAEYAVYYTRSSQILEAIEIAIEETICRLWICSRLMVMFRLLFRSSVKAWLAREGMDAGRLTFEKM